MIEEERKRIHLRKRNEIDGSYTKYIQRIAKDSDDFNDRPYHRLKTVLKVIRVLDDPKFELFAP